MNPTAIPVPSPSLETLLASYEQPELCSASRKEYERDIAAFLAWLAGRPLTPETLIGYRDELQEAGRVLRA
jgi:hypothetical protein